MKHHEYTQSVHTPTIHTKGTDLVYTTTLHIYSTHQEYTATDPIFIVTPASLLQSGLDSSLFPWLVTTSPLAVTAARIRQFNSVVIPFGLLSQVCSHWTFNSIYCADYWAQILFQ